MATLANKFQISSLTGSYTFTGDGILGPESSVDENVMIFNGTTGQQAKDSGIKLSAKANVNQQMYIGQTALALNRTSAILSLTGVSIDGDAGTVGGRAATYFATASHTQTIGTISDSTTLGQNLITKTSPSAITFLRINEDNSVDTLNAADYRTAIGAGTSSFDGTYGSLSGTPLTFTPSAHTQTIASISDATTVGQNLTKLTNPSAITFLRINANNSVDALGASDFRTAIGAGTGGGDADTLQGHAASYFATASHTQTVATISDATTVGQNIVKLTNPSAITFPRINADNTITALSAADFRTAIGAGTPGVTDLGITPTDTLSGLTSGTYVVVGTITLSAPTTVAADIHLIMPKGAMIDRNGYALTLNCTFEAGPYQIFTGSGTVTFGTTSKLQATHPEWWYSGSGVWNTAILAAINSRLGCPCILLTPAITIDDIIIPSGADFRGIGATGSLASSGYYTLITHAPVTPGGYIMTSSPALVTSAPITLSNFALIADASGNTGGGLRIYKALGYRISNIAIAGPCCSSANLVMEHIQDCTLNEIKVSNSNSSYKSPAGHLITRAVDDIISTSTSINKGYIAGNSAWSSTGGIDIAIQTNSGCCLGIIYNDMTMESINTCGWDIHESNRLDINNLYVEHIPNRTRTSTDCLFKIGLTTDAAITIPPTSVTIKGGRASGWGEGIASTAFRLNKIDNLIVDGVQFQSFDVMVNYTSSGYAYGNCIWINCHDNGDLSSTAATAWAVDYPSNIGVDRSNNFHSYPWYTRERGFWTERPILQLVTGMPFYDLDAKKTRYYDTPSSSWREADGTLVVNNNVANGTFIANVKWTVGSGWSIGSNKATHTSGTAALSQSGVATAGVQQDVHYTVSGCSAGGVTINLGGSNGTQRTADGDYTDTLTPSNSVLTITPTNDFNGSVSAISAHNS